MKIVMYLLKNLTKNPPILEISKELNQKYPQTYNTIKQLEEKGVVIISNLKNNKRVRLNLRNTSIIQAEIERTQNLPEEIKLIQRKLPDYPTILFGSQIENYKESSDIDLLVIVSKDFRKIEEEIYNKLIIHNIDLNLVTKEDLEIMWQKDELNIGNEILRKHIILKGFERIINLFSDGLEKYYKRIN